MHKKFLPVSFTLTLLLVGCGTSETRDTALGAQFSLASARDVVQSLTKASNTLEGTNEPADCDEGRTQTPEQYAEECRVAMDDIGVEKFDCSDPTRSIEVPEGKSDPESRPTSEKHETIVPLGNGPSNPGFCYWKSVHGPFCSNTSRPNSVC